MSTESKHSPEALALVEKVLGNEKVLNLAINAKNHRIWIKEERKLGNHKTASHFEGSLKAIEANIRQIIRHEE